MANETSAASGSTIHLPELDGIRGLAILPVLIYHFVDRYSQPSDGLGFLFYKVSQAGWIGVDLFFVLSGFLITGILLDTKDNPRYFKSFFGRRFLRIFPLYYAMLVLYFWIGPTFSDALARQYQAMQQHQSWFWTYWANWLFASTKGDIPGIYFWSLAVEEQFYLVWPWLVWFCSSRALLLVSAGLFALSLALRLNLVLGWDYTAASVYYMTFTHMDGLAVGACIAIAARRWDLVRVAGRNYIYLGAACLLALLVTAGFNKGFPFWSHVVGTYSYSLLAMLFGTLLLVILNSPRESWLRRIFNNDFMRLSGKYSYALYLFHVPISNLVQTLVFDKLVPRATSLQHYFAVIIPFIALSTLASYVAAYVSWNVLEKRALAFKKYFPY